MNCFFGDFLPHLIMSYFFSVKVTDSQFYQLDIFERTQ